MDFRTWATQIECSFAITIMHPCYMSLSQTYFKSDATYETGSFLPPQRNSIILLHGCQYSCLNIFVLRDRSRLGEPPVKCASARCHTHFTVTSDNRQQKLVDFVEVNVLPRTTSNCNFPLMIQCQIAQLVTGCYITPIWPTGCHVTSWIIRFSNSPWWVSILNVPSLWR